MIGPGKERRLFVLSRWVEYGAEHRVNALRTIGVVAFYLIELMVYYGVDLGPFQVERVRDEEFHAKATVLAGAWLAMAATVHTALRVGRFPNWFGFATVAADVALLSMVLGVGDGPRSPLVLGYLLIVAMSGVRLRLPLVWFATGAAAFGYLGVIGHAWLTSETRDVRVPRYEELMVLTGLLIAGLVQGQTVRRARALAESMMAEKETSP